MHWSLYRPSIYLPIKDPLRRSGQTPRMDPIHTWSDHQRPPLISVFARASVNDRVDIGRRAAPIHPPFTYAHRSGALRPVIGDETDELLLHRL